MRCARRPLENGCGNPIKPVMAGGSAISGMSGAAGSVAKAEHDAKMMAPHVTRAAKAVRMLIIRPPIGISSEAIRAARGRGKVVTINSTLCPPRGGRSGARRDRVEEPLVEG